MQSRVKNIFEVGKNFLSRIPTSLFYVLLFISLLVPEIYNFHLNPDLSIQLHTLKNFVHGNGVALTGLDQNNRVIYPLCSLWPAGLVLFLSPFYLLTKSAIASAFILYIVTDFFFILFLAKYFNYLKLEKYKRNIIILFFAISVSPFIEFHPSDFLATLFCLWGFYFNLKYIDNKRYLTLVISIFFLGLSYLVKYSFLPFLFYPAASLVLRERASFFKNARQLIIIVSTIFVVALIIYLLNNSLVGKAQLVSQFDAFKGTAHWNQLSHFDGFLFTFSTYEWAFERSFTNYFGINLKFNWISILVTLFFYIIFLKHFFKRRSQAKSPLLDSINISLSAGFLISFFLAFLTINNAGQTWTKPYWTFVEGTRYYGPVIIIGFINILVILMTRRKFSVLHIAILLMMILNIKAYKFAIQYGFWGDNFKSSYMDVKKNISEIIPGEGTSKLPVVFFEGEADKSYQYYYLQSQGTILLNRNQLQPGQMDHNKYLYYDLKIDSLNNIKILKIN